MRARHKLNHFSILGCLIIAAVIGGMTGSWTVFAISAAVLIGGAIYSGDIRPDRRRR